MVKNAPVGFALFDTDLRVEWYNETLRSYLEEPYRDMDLRGLRFEEFVPGMAGSPVLDIFASVIATGEPYTHPEYEYEGFARGTTWWEWTLLRLVIGGEIKLMFLVREVTEEVKLRRQIEEEKSRLRTVLETLPVAVWISDKDGKILEANATAATIWGAAPLAENISEYGQYKAWWADTGKEDRPEEWGLAAALLRG
jgi:PAS domain-containing protein